MEKLYKEFCCPSNILYVHIFVMNSINYVYNLIIDFQNENFFFQKLLNWAQLNI